MTRKLTKAAPDLLRALIEIRRFALAVEQSDVKPYAGIHRILNISKSAIKLAIDESLPDNISQEQG